MATFQERLLAHINAGHTDPFPLCPLCNPRPAPTLLPTNQDQSLQVVMGQVNWLERGKKLLRKGYKP